MGAIPRAQRINTNHQCSAIHEQLAAKEFVMGNQMLGSDGNQNSNRTMRQEDYRRLVSPTGMAQKLTQIPTPFSPSTGPNPTSVSNESSVPCGTDCEPWFE